jgi:hypothetical protein
VSDEVPKIGMAYLELLLKDHKIVKWIIYFWNGL